MRSAASERRQPEQRGVALGFQRGDVRLALIAQRGDADQVELLRTSRLDPRAGDMHRAIKQRDGLVGHRDLLRRRSGIGIGAHRVGDNRHLHRVAIGLGRLPVAARRLDVALHAAEQIDLVGYAETGIDAPLLALGAGQHFIARHAAIGGRCIDRGLRQPVRLGAAQIGTGALEMGDRDTQIRIGGERIGDQAVEHRIIIEMPPLVVSLGGSVHRWAGRSDEGLRGTPRRGRPVIVRPGRTGGQRRAGKQQGEEGFRHGSKPHSAGWRIAGSPPRRRREKRSPSARHTT